MSKHFTQNRNYKWQKENYFGVILSPEEEERIAF